MYAGCRPGQQLLRWQLLKHLIFFLKLQANRPITDQGQVLPPPDNERNKTVKNLALQTASLLKWNLSLLEKELPIAARHQLLTELIKACKTSMPLAPQVSLFVFWYFDAILLWW